MFRVSARGILGKVAAEGSDARSLIVSLFSETYLPIACSQTVPPR